MNFLTKDQFAEMWKLQDALNAATSGPDWTKKNQDWSLAIKDEIMEFYNYIGWKWWKEPDATKSPKDMQARLELVDIWHFLLSHIIEFSGQDSEQELGYIQHFIARFNEEPDLSSIKLLDGFGSLYYKIVALDSVLRACDWSWQELYSAYIGKVALNNFRQANGYKEGTYQKLWWGEEDNAHLEHVMAMLDMEDNVTYDRVYSALSQGYAAWKEDLAEQCKDL